MTDLTWSDEYVADPDEENEDIESEFSIVELQPEDEETEESDLDLALAAFLAGDEDNDWEPDSWDDDGPEPWSEADPL